MKINRTNYEIYFLDYLDGNLPDDQIDDFLDFLEKNPDLHEELKAVSEIKLSPGPEAFQQKEILRKEGMSGVSEFDYQAVAYLEGDLEGDDEKTFVETITKDEVQEKQFDLFLKTKLHPDPQIIFPDKEKLYRKSGIKIFLTWSGRVAAGLILLIGIWSVLNYQSNHEKTDQPITNQQSAQVEPLAAPQNEVVPDQAVHEEIASTQPAKRMEALPVKNKVIPTPSVSPKTELVARNNRVLERDPAPQKIQSLTAQVAIHPENMDRALIAMNENADEAKYLTVDELLAQKVFHQKQGENISVSGVLSAGLKAVSNATNDRLDYETNQQGKVSEISLNTRLLAFSIPFRKR